MPFVRTDDNIADFFTKPLSSKRFFHLRDIIMNVPSQADAAALTEQLYDAPDKYAAVNIISEHHDA